MASGLSGPGSVPRELWQGDINGIRESNAVSDSTESNGYPDTHSRVAPLRLSPDSGPVRTPLRGSSDTLPLVPKTVRPHLGTLSNMNWNVVRQPPEYAERPSHSVMAASGAGFMG